MAVGVVQGVEQGLCGRGLSGENEEQRSVGLVGERTWRKSDKGESSVVGWIRETALKRTFLASEGQLRESGGCGRDVCVDREPGGVWL